MNRTDTTEKKRPAGKAFGGYLRLARGIWQSGLVMRAVIRAMGAAIVIILVFGALDFFLAFGPGMRFALDGTGGAALGLMLVLWIASAFRLTDRDMAIRADTLLGDRRRRILTALELKRWLDRSPDSSTGLTGFLAGQSIESAGNNLRRLGLRRSFPNRELGLQLRTFGIQIALAALIFGIYPEAGGTVLRRIVAPQMDIPPYSRYRFNITPEQPTVIYGGDAEISAEIDGPPVRAQVWFVSRYGGKTHRTACFQEGPRKFAQRIEKAVKPVEFCFAVGKARSKWRSVELLLQPEIAAARLEVEAPSYSRLPKRVFYAGSESLAGLRKSKVKLTVTSNRPLLDGTVTVKPVNGDSGHVTAQGSRTSANTVAFDWMIEESAQIDVTVRDIMGTSNRRPLRIAQQLIPDKPPSAAIDSPAQFALATPGVVMPLAGRAEDDLGVAEVRLVKALYGYRDRAEKLGPEFVVSRFGIEDKLDLKSLGVQPGQCLEFFLEAMDLNPDMTGVGASDIVRVQIISEQEYATMLRAKADIAEFTERYRIVESAFLRTTAALAGLRNAIEQGVPDERQAELRDAAVDAARAAADLYDKMKEDFPAFHAEKRLQETLTGMAAVMRLDSDLLAQMRPGDLGLKTATRKFLEDLGQWQDDLIEQVHNAEEIERLAGITDCAGRFRSVAGRQNELVRRLQRFGESARSADNRILASLAARQEEIHKDLLAMKEDVINRALLLNDWYGDLKEDALGFAEKINELEILSLMSRAVTAGRNQDGRETHRLASLALERIQQMLNETKDDPFGGLCQGEMGFDARPGVKPTLQQIIDAMGMGPEGRTGISGAGMIGGHVSDGYWMSGHSPLNIPVYGPQRTSFSHLRTMAEGAGGSAGTGGSGPGSPSAAVESERITHERTERTGGDTIPFEQVPVKYRDAVRRYFGVGSETAGGGGDTR